VPFDPYVVMKVRWHLVGVCRRISDRTFPLGLERDIAEPPSGSDHGHDDPDFWYEDGLERTRDRQTLHAFTRWLRDAEPRLATVAALRLDGFTLLQVGQVLGLTESMTARLERRLHDVARQWFIDHAR
jgi:hypothetical protein